MVHENGIPKLNKSNTDDTALCFKTTFPTPLHPKQLFAVMGYLAWKDITQGVQYRKKVVNLWFRGVSHLPERCEHLW